MASLGMLLAITKATTINRSSHHRDMAPTSRSINNRSMDSRRISNHSMGSRRISNRNTAVRGNGLRVSSLMDMEARLSHNMLPIKATISSLHHMAPSTMALSTMSTDTGIESDGLWLAKLHYT